MTATVAAPSAPNPPSRPRALLSLRIAIFGGVAAAALAALVLSAVPASAHVTLAASSTAAGATSVLRMEVPHGCEGSATTEVAVRTPDSSE